MTDSTTPGPRILVVDDNDDNRYTLTLYLELEGYADIQVAEDGEQAIGRLDKESFDLVLLDVMMPKVDGYQVPRWLKDQRRLHDLPVIMISALNEMTSVVRCIELGAVDYLLKPFNQVLLKARLGASLEKKRLRDQVNAHLFRLEEELEAARDLQMSMLPQVFPQPARHCPVDVWGLVHPAREVGGDLYDFFTTADGSLCFFVDDVSGKGMPAALFMARTKSLMRVATELMREREGAAASPADIIARVNRELCQNNNDMMFVTLFFGMLALDTGEVLYCNAGHNPPYRVNGGTPRAIEDAKGMILRHPAARGVHDRQAGPGPRGNALPLQRRRDGGARSGRKPVLRAPARGRAWHACRSRQPRGRGRRNRSAKRLRRHGPAVRRHYHAGATVASRRRVMSTSAAQGKFIDVHG